LFVLIILFPVLLFLDWFFVLRQGETKDMKYATLAEAQVDGAITENLGNFLAIVFNFFLTAFILFLFIRFSESFLTAIRKTVKMEDKNNTIECKFCFSQINPKATKCAFCTSTFTETANTNTTINKATNAAINSTMKRE
jgi:large conductance mechanosensitive channel